MRIGDLVKLKPMYQPTYEWYLLQHPPGGTNQIVGRFNTNQVGTVIELGRDFIRILVGDQIGWIDVSIVCKVDVKPGDLVQIKPQYSKDRFGGRAHMNLFQHPLDFENYPERVIVGTFTSDQVGTVLDFSVKYDSKHCIERKDMKVLVGECIGWIEDKILCKVDE